MFRLTTHALFFAGFAVCLLVISAPAQQQQSSRFAPGASAPVPAVATTAPTVSDREQDGLLGPVRRVRVEMAKLTQSGGNLVESPKVLLEVAAYDPKGGKIDNAYYPVAGNALTGKEVYKYDDKGNITEMTLYGGDGAVLSKEVYAYDFDTLGNWTKMTSSVAVIEDGKVAFEPSEVTYRAITYYLGGTTAKLLQPTTAISNRVKLPALATSASKTGVYTSPIVARDPAPGFSNAANASVVKINEAPPDRPVRRGPLRPISRGVLNGTATSLPRPIYPEVAKRSRTAGVVTVEVIVDEKGKVISASATGGPAMLQQAAIAAANQARFSPTLLSGQPVKVSGVITYNFQVN